MRTSGEAVMLGPELIERACDHITPRPRRIFVGYSGGMDSTVLLHLVSSWAAQQINAQRSSVKVIALHVNHGVQSDSADWQARCAAVAETLGVDFRSHRLSHEPPPTSPKLSEAAARQGRYDYFAGQLEHRDDVILLGHHQRDQAETLLLRAFQGRSLSGMPSQRRCGAGQLLRPLLPVAHDRLQEYARVHGLEWVDDPSNASLTFDRNRIRQEIMPLAAQRWPQVARTLAALGERQLAQQGLLEQMLQHWVRVPLSFCAPPDLGCQVLRFWLQRYQEGAVTDRALADFVAQLWAPADRQPTLALGQGALRRYRDHVYYVATEPPNLDERYLMQGPGTLQLPHGSLQVPAGTVPPGVANRGSLAVVFAESASNLSPVSKQRWQALGVPPWARGRFPQLRHTDGPVVQPLALPRLQWADELTAQASGGGAFGAESAIWMPN